VLHSTQATITLSPAEKAQIEELERLLRRGSPSLVGRSGKRVKLPGTIYQVLRRVVALMAEGNAVTLMPENEVITTQKAANLLGMSRPFFIKLLNSGAMAHHRVGNQRRVYLRDVLQYARRRDRERHAALDRLSRQAYEAGLYDKNRFPEGGQDE